VRALNRDDEGQTEDELQPSRVPFVLVQIGRPQPEPGSRPRLLRRLVTHRRLPASRTWM
jgi:hypothetical protein